MYLNFYERYFNFDSKYKTLSILGDEFEIRVQFYGLIYYIMILLYYHKNTIRAIGHGGNWLKIKAISFFWKCKCLQIII